jgi:hypothetical protein
VAELSLRAPSAARPFAQALSELAVRGELARALALSERLRPAWAAELASRVLNAPNPREATAALEECQAEFRMAAERHLYAIRSFGRIALPLALGVAIVELSLTFERSAGAPIPTRLVHSAIECALRATVTGMTTAAFCQLSVTSLQRQAAARLLEVRIVSEALTSQMIRTTR